MHRECPEVFRRSLTRKIIFDNLKAAVISGSGKYACFHPEFLELCGHFHLQPVACARRDPESKGHGRNQCPLREAECPGRS